MFNMFKYSNYKNLSFMSDSTYSVFKALKHEALLYCTEASPGT